MIKEIEYGIYNQQYIDNLISEGKALLFKARRPVLVGSKCLLKVNTNVGVSSTNGYNEEVNKVLAISKLSYRPDAMMDHSIVQFKKPLWKVMVENFDGAVGTLPHYLTYNEKSGINETDFFDNLLEMAKGGVSFVTLHPTAELSLYDVALNSKRSIPTTSRGGFVLLRDQVINGRQHNIVAKNFDRILEILKCYKMAISIGSVFRPGTIHEAFDDLHKRETDLQKTFIDRAKSYGVHVQMEGVGHMSLDMMNIYASYIRPFNVPLMPLGPMPSDEIIGFDHITNAIGSTIMAQTGILGIINSVTREEHTGKVPSFSSVIEGLKAARVAAHCYNVSVFPEYRKRTEINGLMRAKTRSCVQQGGLFEYEIDSDEQVSCSRCKRECPLKPIY